MADGSAEAAFFSNMRTAQQAGDGEDVVLNGGNPQIEEEESSDEYDPSAQSFPDSSYAPPDSTLPPADAPATVLKSTSAASSAAPTPSNAEIVQQPPSDTAAVPAQQDADVPSKPTTPAATSLPKARLPHDRIGILEDRISDDEKGDIQAWLELIDEHRKRGKLDEVRKVYDRFFEVFPYAADEYASLVQLENDAGNKQKVEAVFAKTLSKLPSLKMWLLYLNHIRRYFNIQTDRTGKASQTVHNAYQAVLDAVGGDPDVGAVWMDYIGFVKSGPGVVGGSSWQDGQKMDVLRKSYQQAIVTPHQDIETLWKEYTAFELGINKQTGRKFLQDKSPEYMTARSAFAEQRKITLGLARTSLPRLPPAAGFDGYEEYMQQVELWKRWINWEKNDPLVIKEEDPAKWKKRVIYVYKQALMALYFWPEMWLEAAEFCFENDHESGNEFLAQGITANPESALLAFRQADRLELSTTNGNDEDSKAARGDKVREPYDKCLDALYALVTKVQASETSQIALVEAEAAANPEQTTKGQDDDNEDAADDPELAEAQKQRQQRVNGIKAFAKMRTDRLYKTITLVWIALMRTFQRMQGKGKPGAKVPGSRGIFADARKRGRLTSELYSAAALLEYHSGEKDPGSRIFERGTRLFPHDELFALEYIKFLVLTNDTTNARVVFETTVKRLQDNEDPDAKYRAKPLFAFFRRFEAQYGELSQVMKLEDRMRVAFPDDPKLWSFSQRFVESDSPSDFDVTRVQQIISPATQAKPRMPFGHGPPPPLQAAGPGVSPQVPPAAPIMIVSSPKRSLPDDFAETNAAPVAKIPRGESPLKGAAGRRMQAQQANAMGSTPVMTHSTPISQYSGPPAPPQLPPGVNYLLSIIPSASTYNATRLNPDAMVRLVGGLHVPGSQEELNALVASRAQYQQQQQAQLPQGQQQQYWGQR